MRHEGDRKIDRDADWVVDEKTRKSVTCAVMRVADFVMCMCDLQRLGCEGAELGRE